MVQRILINRAGRCWECRAEIEDKRISARPKYCGDQCRQAVEQRMAARGGRGQCGWGWNQYGQRQAVTRNETQKELVRTKEALKKAQEELDWQRREFQHLADSFQARPADTDEVRWMITELTRLPGVGGTGDYDIPESIVARVRGILTEANNRAMAWEKKARKNRGWQ